MELIFVIISFLLVSVAFVTIVYLFLKRQHDHSLVQLQTELAMQRQNYFLPSKLEAYQRCILLLDRISPANLTLRTLQVTNNARTQQSLLVKTVREEFEHNIAQQIYFTQESWEIILKAKNSIITQIRRFSIEGEVASGEELRTKLLQELTQTESASAVAISFIKEELKRVF